MDGRRLADRDTVRNSRSGRLADLAGELCSVNVLGHETGILAQRAGGAAGIIDDQIKIYANCRSMSLERTHQGFALALCKAVLADHIPRPTTQKENAIERFLPVLQEAARAMRKLI